VHPGTIFDHFVPGHSHQLQLRPFSTCLCSTSRLAGRINSVQSGIFFFFFPLQSVSQTALAQPKRCMSSGLLHPSSRTAPRWQKAGSVQHPSLVYANAIANLPIPFPQAEKRGSPRQKRGEGKSCVGLKQFLKPFPAFYAVCVRSAVCRAMSVTPCRQVCSSGVLQIVVIPLNQ